MGFSLSCAAARYITLEAAGSRPWGRVTQSASSPARRGLHSFTPRPSRGAPVIPLRYATPPPWSSGARESGVPPYGAGRFCRLPRGGLLCGLGAMRPRSVAGLRLDGRKPDTARLRPRFNASAPAF